MLSQEHTYACFQFLGFVKKRCYCVTYVRILLFLIFCISQGSVETHLSCGGKYKKVLAANLLLSPTVKEFGKSDDICLQSCA